MNVCPTNWRKEIPCTLGRFSQATIQLLSVFQSKKFSTFNSFAGSVLFEIFFLNNIGAKNGTNSRKEIPSTSYISIAFGFFNAKSFQLLTHWQKQKNQPFKHQLRQFRIWLSFKSRHWQYPRFQQCTKTFGNYRILD